MIIVLTQGIPHGQVVALCAKKRNNTSDSDVALQHDPETSNGDESEELPQEYSEEQLPAKITEVSIHQRHAYDARHGKVARQRYDAFNIPCGQNFEPGEEVPENEDPNKRERTPHK